MTILTTVSTPATGDDAIFELKQQAVAAGWVVTASGDGVSAYGPYGGPTSDVITTSAELVTAGAWFRLKMPGATREFLFIRLGATTSWNILYSVAGFFGGSPSATVAPTAADQQTLINGTLLAADGTYRWLLSFDNAAPYECWAGGLTIGTLAATSAIFCLAMAAGSYDVTDVDPYALIATGTNVLMQIQLWQSDNSSYRNAHGWYRYGLGAAAWQAVAFGTIWFGQGNIGAESTIVSSGLSASVSGQEVPLSIVAGFRQNPVFGIKGRVRGAMYTLATSGTVPNGTQLLDGDGLYWVRVGDLWLQWDSSVPTL